MVLRPITKSSSDRHLRLRAAGVVVAFVGLGLLGGCSGEKATPVDLNVTTTVADDESVDDEGTGSESVLEGDVDDPNAEQNRVTLGYAEQQCLDDPELEQGYVQIVDPSTDEKVGEVTADCEEVRNR